MINLVIAFVFVVLWVVIFTFKPYCYTKSKFCTNFWIVFFSLVGGIAGGFICQSIIYLCGGHTFLN